MSSSLSGAIPAQHADAVAVITLNRPDRRNALTPVMLDELVVSLDHAAADHREGVDAFRAKRSPVFQGR